MREKQWCDNEKNCSNFQVLLLNITNRLLNFSALDDFLLRRNKWYFLTGRWMWSLRCIQCHLVCWHTFIAWSCFGLRCHLNQNFLYSCHSIFCKKKKDLTTWIFFLFFERISFLRKTFIRICLIDSLLHGHWPVKLSAHMFLSLESKNTLENSSFSHCLGFDVFHKESNS